MYNAQKNYTVSEYETALSGWSASSPVVYNAYGGYGYVYNLLIGVNAAQNAEISALKEESNLSTAEYRAKRAEILSRVEAKDLRSTWITAGYDFDYDSKKFTHDYRGFRRIRPSLYGRGGMAERRRGGGRGLRRRNIRIKNVTRYDLNGVLDLIDSTLLSGVSAKR